HFLWFWFFSKPASRHLFLTSPSAWSSFQDRSPLSVPSITMTLPYYTLSSRDCWILITLVIILPLLPRPIKTMPKEEKIKILNDIIRTYDEELTKAQTDPDFKQQVLSKLAQSLLACKRFNDFVNKNSKGSKTAVQRLLNALTEINIVEATDSSELQLCREQLE